MSIESEEVTHERKVTKWWKNREAWGKYRVKVFVMRVALSFQNMVKCCPDTQKKGYQMSE